MKLRIGLRFLALLVALPLAAAAAEFPALPPSRPCASDDVIGLWQLAHVYEVPEGRELADFNAFPVQYLFLNSNNVYDTLRPNHPEKPAEIIKAMSGEHHPLQQFVVDKSGFLLFYQNRVATDTQACFIVANKTDKFGPGQMLLMPPQGQHVGRLVKVYAKMWMPPGKK